MTQSVDAFQAAENNRTISWKDPMQIAQDCEAMNGLQYWQAIQFGKVSPTPINTLIGIDVVEVDKGRIVLAITPEEYHYGSFGTIQNGLTATLLDTAIGSAIHTTLPAGTGYTTIDINIRYMRSITLETGIIYCEGSVIQVNGRVANVGAKVFDKTKKLYAHATAKCMIQAS